jgi:predicted ATPase/class 3 adenylate cyclase/DNA-binding XRE family transcriptional regulator
MEQHSFGHWLRLKRKALDLTREQLAERVGYSAATIRKLEDEERHPSEQVVERLAEIFNIPQNERVAFLRFARGDLQASPASQAENIPWMTCVRKAETIDPKIHLATFLFTDIEGSAKLWEAAPQQMKIALQRHHAILQGAIESNGGLVFQIIGDAFCAAFPTAFSAISAAVTAQQELHQEEWGLPFPIRVRMGIHMGEAEQTANSGYASNPTLNRVARILSAAHGGQVLLSLATKDLVKDGLPANTELRDMGEHHLRNLISPEHLFQLSIVGLPSDFPPLNTLTHRHNLPVQLTSFIAREEEVARVHEYLTKDDIRLLTLIGPPGIGKTRLSITAARAALIDFPDGVFFVALAPLEDANLIAAAIAQALGYVGAKNISTIRQLKEGIGDKHLLLVLDNCEHLIENIASLASDLLSACPHLKILATSRESLRIPGEWLYAIPAFDLPAESSSLDLESAAKYPALTLFEERARAVRSDFSLNADNIETVAAICAHLDGLPLVIELIAARMRLMSPSALLDRLSGQFVLTADGMRAASECQKTLQNAIDWSYKLLPLEEQKLFAYLSVFSSSFTLDATEAMFSQKVTEKPLPNLIALLLDKSLLKLAPDAEAKGEARYTMLVTIQEYARQRLREMGEEIEIRNVHLAYFLDLAEKAVKELRGHNQLEWLSRLNSDRDNLRAALEWAIETEQTEIALQLARKLHWFWFVRGDHSEGRRWLGRVLEMPGTSSHPEAYAEVLAQMAHHLYLQLGEKEARPFAEKALSIARTNHDKHNTARGLAMLGLVLKNEEDFAASQAAFEESKILYRDVHDEWGYAHVELCLAYLASGQNDHKASLALNGQALALFRKLGDRYFECVVLRGMGTSQMMVGDLMNAVATLQKALILARQLNSRYEAAQTLWRCAEAAHRAENSARAVCLYFATKNFINSVGAWTERDELFFENDLMPCRTALSEAEFEEAMEQGHSMTMEQAIAYALENIDE